MRRFLVLALVLTCGATSALAQYRWVDKSGRVQYGDVPPAGARATPLRPPAGPSGSAQETATPSPAEREVEFRRRQLEAAQEREKREQVAEQTAARKENCERARESLRTLESGQRIARTDAKGERYFLDEAQIAQEAERARRAVQQSC